MNTSSVVTNFGTTLDDFIANRQGTRGLTPKGERWLRDTLGKFMLWLSVPIATVNSVTVISFLSQYGRIDEVEDVLYVKDGRDFKVVHSQSTTERVIDKIRGLVLSDEWWNIKEIAEELPGHSVEKTIRPALKELVLTGELKNRVGAGKGGPEEYTWGVEERE